MTNLLSNSFVPIVILALVFNVTNAIGFSYAYVVFPLLLLMRRMILM